MSKVVVKGHRSDVTPNDVSMVLTVMTRTFDFHQMQNPGVKKISRVEFTKKVVEFLDSIGVNKDLYLDAFPAEWDVEFKD